jgi:hypothetical protein
VKCTGQTVRSWRNDTDVDDSDSDAKEPNGRRNPLDDFLDFLSAVGARSAQGAAIITEKVVRVNELIQADSGREELMKEREAIRRARHKAREFLEATEQFGDG